MFNAASLDYSEIARIEHGIPPSDRNYDDLTREDLIDMNKRRNRDVAAALEVARNAVHRYESVEGQLWVWLRLYRAQLSNTDDLLEQVTTMHKVIGVHPTTDLSPAASAHMLRSVKTIDTTASGYPELLECANETGKNVTRLVQASKERTLRCVAGATLHAVKKGSEAAVQTLVHSNGGFTAQNHGPRAVVARRVSMSPSV